MKLHLIRHAQSSNNALPEEQRVHDPGLTSLGGKQARHLAEWISTLELGRLISSPFLRAMETTAALLEATGLIPEIRVELHEQGGCYQGHFPSDRMGQPGMTRQELQERFPRFVVAMDIGADGWWKSRPYETTGQAKARACRLLQDIHREYGDSATPVAMVMHADIMMLMLESMLPERFEVPHNTSVTTLQLTPSEIRLLDYNRVEHLPKGLLSC